MLATLVGLSLLLALIGGTTTLAVVLLGRRLRARHARRHPQQAATRGPRSRLTTKASVRLRPPSPAPGWPTTRRRPATWPTPGVV